MKYDAVQTLLETYVKENFTETPLIFENVPLSTENLTEYARFNVQFGDTLLRSLGTRCYRILGVVFLSFFVRPSVGIERITKLADAAQLLFLGQSISPVSSTDPTVMFLGTSFRKDPRDRDGWVMGQLSGDFYYDVEI